MALKPRVSANDILQQLPEPRPSAQDESAHRLVGIGARDYETLGLRILLDCCALIGSVNTAGARWTYEDIGRQGQRNLRALGVSS